MKRSRGEQRVLGVLSAMAIALSSIGIALAAPSAAQAASPTAAWNSGATGAVTSITTNVAGLNIAGLRVSTTSATADSSTSPRTRGLSQNIGATVAALPIALQTLQQTAPPQQSAAATGGLGTLTNNAVVTAGLISASDRARWTLDTACVTGSDLSTSTTSVANLTVLPGIGGTTGLLSTAVAQTTGSTLLTPNSGLNYGVRSTASGSIDTINVLDAATIQVLQAPSLTTTASGTGTPTLAYTPTIVRVTVGTGAPITLSLGGTESTTLNLGALGNVTIGLNRPTSTISGNSITASYTPLSITANLLPNVITGVPLVTASVPLLPLTSTAVAPAGGIDCPAPPAAPAITVPVTGTVTNVTTPTISGTAVAGSTVTVLSDGALIGTTTATAGGTWTLTPATPLSQGSHDLTATATTAAGTSAPSNTVTITIDTTAPAAPVVTAPANGSTTANTRPAITGTAEAGSTVTVRIDGTDVGTTTATAGGTFSFATPTALAQGSHTVSATSTDAAGNVSIRSNTTSFTVDTTAPSAPVVVTPANGSITNSRTPTLSGTAEANSTVRVTLDGTTTVTTTATAGGSWSVASPSLADGAHTVSATSTDAAGNVSVDSNTNTFTVDATAPAAPVVATPANGALIATRTPPITGTAEANSTVTVSIDGTVRGTTTANGSGAWTFASPSLADGSHTVSATSTDAAGNLSPVSNTNTFTVDATAPAAPVVTTPANGSLIATRSPTLSGTAETNSLVTVTVDGTVVGTVTASGAGSWSILQPTPLADGAHTVSAVARDAAGNVSAVSNTNTFTVDATAPSAPTITAPANGSSTTAVRPPISGTAEANATVTVTLDGVTLGTTAANGSGAWSITPGADLAQGQHTASATARDAAGNVGPASATTTFTVDSIAPAAPVIVSPPNGSTVADRTPAITGTAEPAAAVTVSLNGTVIGTTIAAANGVWSISPSTNLADGSYTATAVARDPAGNTGPVSNSTTFTVNASASGAPTVTAPADGSTTTSQLPVYNGTADAGTTVTVYVDGTAVGTTATAGGTWTFTQPAPLADGQHTVAATARVGAGPVSPLSNTNTFTVDATAPAAPVVATPANGSTVTTRTPPITGTAEANSTVTVFLGATSIGTTTANASGAWTLTAPSLADGSYTATATARDAAGNTSLVSNATTFTVDATPPAAPAVTTPANNALVNTRTPTLAGTSEGSALVTVTVDGVVIGTTTATSAGTWSIVQPTPLADGSHTVSAVARDAAGNVSAISNTNTFTVDATLPGAPIVASPANGSTTSAVRPPITGTTEASSTVTVRIDGADVGTTPANGSGAWTYTPTADLGQGQHTASATASDAAGNTGPRSNTTTFTVDSIAPAAPVVLTPVTGSTTTDRTPTITGTAEANATVAVTIDGSATPVTTTASGTGAWSVVAPALADGSHTAYAVATDAAGNASVRSNTTTFTVDATPPAAPVVAAPPNGSTVNTRTPTYTGAAEAGSTVNVIVDGTSIGTTTAAGGAWSLPQPTQLADGGHSVTATATDAAGNTSAAATGNGFTVDATAPAPPVVTAPANGALISTRTPTYSGTAEAGSTVTVTVDTGVIGTTIATGGVWSLPQPTSLGDGVHTVSATARDAAGNTSLSSTTNTFRVDATAPIAPIVTTPADGSTVTTRTPQLAGTAEAGSTVSVRIGGIQVATTTASGTGAWSVTQPSALADGSYALTAVATDAAGNTSPVSNTNTFTVDATAPAAPVITSPVDGSTVANVRPPITGTTEPNAVVTVTLDGTVVGTATANGSGAWTFTPTADLAQGSHTVSATARDAAGNTGPASATTTFTVDTVAPGAPTITTPADTSVTNDSTPTYSGTAEANATVAVTVDGTGVGTTTSDGTGAWSLTPAAALADGTHTVYATATDAVGNTSVRSTTTTFRVDTAAPATPTISSPANGALVRNVRPSITGTAEANATVTVRVDGALLGTVTANGSGAWTITPGADLAQGAHTATATATDAAGNTGAAASTTFTIDTLAPAAPAITAPADGSVTRDSTPDITGTAEPGASVAVTVDGVLLGTVTANGTGAWTFTPTTALADGSHTVSAAATDPAGNPGPSSPTVTFTVDTAAPVAPVITTPPNGSVTSDTTPTISGTAEPSSTVTVSVDGVVLGTTTAAATGGAWSLTPSAPLAEGAHNLSATASDAAGNTSAAATSTFTIDTTAPSAPVITAPDSGSSTDDPFPVFEGTAEPGSSVTVTVDGTVVGTAVTGSNGRWNLRSAVRLADGLRRAVASARDAAGNSSPNSGTTPFTVDTVAPNAPVIAAPANGSTTTDTTPTIAGTAEPGVSVTVSVDGTPIGTVVAGSGGAWTLDPTSPLAIGTHTARAVATDAAGNASPTSAPSIFTVDPNAPAAPVVSAPTDGSSTADTTPTVTGTATPGATVTVVIDGVVVGAGLADAAGGWSVTPTTPLADGDHIVTASSRVGAGPVSASSAPITFTVDTTAPAAPTISGPAPGSVSNDPFPVFTGTAEPGSTVSITVDGTVVGTGTADASGRFSIRSRFRLGDGVRRAIASARDAAGNTSPASAVDAFSIDTVAPAPPTITSPQSGTSTPDPTPTITGRGEPGATITVIADGRVLGTTIVAPDGTWGFTPTTPLVRGAHLITARATDLAGNVSDFSVELSIVVAAVRGAANGLAGTGLGERSTLDLAASAMLLVVLGIVLLLRGRRRARRS